MTNIPQRLTGLGVLLAAAILYDTDNASVIHRLLIPGSMALGAWLVAQNLAAVLIAVTVLATIRTDFASESWLAGRVFPGIALLAGCSLGAIGLSRFRTRIAATRAQRWRHRKSRQQADRQLPQ